jgi:carboxypeptidase Q
MKKIYLFLLFLFLSSAAIGQEVAATRDSDADANFIREIYNVALTKGKAYDWLNYITNNIGGRLSGSPQAAAAVEYTRQMMDSMGMSVVLQPCIVPHWVRGDKEQARVVNSTSMGTVDLSVLALGNSVGTSDYGITASVIEVHSLEEVKKLGAEGKIKGKIVFYNRPMDATKIKTFHAYGGAVDQRGYGAAVAANFGAVGVLVRSMTLRTDDIPHTGALSYEPLEKGIQPIAGMAVSTQDADLLSAMIKNDKEVKVFMKTNCRMLAPKTSYNVIGEIKGSEFPDEIILVGGHLDSWDVGTGAHDDGAGCVHSMDVYHVLKQLNYQPKRTIRVVMFMNEENGLAGALEYAKVSNEKGEYHVAAIESDRGGFTPRGFSVEYNDETLPLFKKVVEWMPLFKPYELELEKGGSGADISPLRSQNGLLVGLAPDSQRYFDYHHTDIDVWDAVNKRELQLGVAAMASLVYMIDQYGLK